MVISRLHLRTFLILRRYALSRLGSMLNGDFETDNSIGGFSSSSFNIRLGSMLNGDFETEGRSTLQFQFHQSCVDWGVC